MRPLRCPGLRALGLEIGGTATPYPGGRSFSVSRPLKRELGAARWFFALAPRRTASSGNPKRQQQCDLSRVGRSVQRHPQRRLTGAAARRPKAGPAQGAPVGPDLQRQAAASIVENANARFGTSGVVGRHPAASITVPAFNLIQDESGAFNPVESSWAGARSHRSRCARSVTNRSQLAMKSAAITGPITNPVSPNSAIPPSVEISTT